MTTTERPDARGWLAAAALPGRPALRRAAAGQVMETVFTVVQWAGLALVAQDAFGHRTQLSRPAPLLLLAGGLLAAGAAWSAARCQATARRQIAGAIRRPIVAGLLPAGDQRPDVDAATAASAAVELAHDVADYHAQAVPQRLSAPASMSVVFAVTAALQWPVAVILLVATLLVPLNLRLAGVFAKEGADERLAASNRLAAVVLDSFRGMRTLQSIGAVQRRRAQLDDAAGRLNAATMAVARRAFLSGTVMEVVITFSIAANATYVGLSLLGYLRIDGAPQVTMFTGLFVLLLCPMYFTPLRAIAAAYHSRERAAAATPTIMSLLGDTAPATDTHAAMPLSGSVTVSIRAGSFSFPGAPRPVLDDLNITFPAGEWTAITGPSGAGKTTLLSLVAGVRRPTTGTVKWIAPQGIAAPRLGSCAWIGQQTVILPGSIAENVRLGRPTASLSDVTRAVSAAGLTDVVAGLPDGLDTQLGEGGLGVSTGEARRIAIARAFLRDSELWVLDEPTAHLDRDAETQVIEALRNATRGRTVVVATHSAAVALCADAVLTVTDATVRTARELLQV